MGKEREGKDEIFYRADKREKQAENTTDIEFQGRHIRIQNGLAIEEYISGIQASTGEIHVVEAEEYAEVLRQQEDSLVAVYTDGYIIGSRKDEFVFGRYDDENSKLREPTYVAWVTTSFSPSENTYEEKPFTYHMVTKGHTREDVTALVKKSGNRLKIK